MDNEVMELIDGLYSMVSEAWGVPLGNDKCIVEREKALSMIEDIKNRLPAELSEAKRLVSARDEFIGNAKREAESIRRAAEEKARAMIDEQEIVRVARAKAAELEGNATARSNALRQAAMEPVITLISSPPRCFPGGSVRTRSAPRSWEPQRKAAHSPRLLWP